MLYPKKYLEFEILKQTLTNQLTEFNQYRTLDGRIIKANMRDEVLIKYNNWLINWNTYQTNFSNYTKAKEFQDHIKANSKLKTIERHQKWQEFRALVNKKAKLLDKITIDNDVLHLHVVNGNDSFEELKALQDLFNLEITILPF